MCKHRLLGALDKTDLLAALTECKQFVDHIEMKKKEIQELVDSASKDHPPSAGFIQSLLNIDGIKTIDKTIDMNMKCIEILKEIRNLYNDDSFECKDLLTVLKSAVIEMY